MRMYTTAQVWDLVWAAAAFGYFLGIAACLVALAAAGFLEWLFPTDGRSRR